MSSIIRRSFNLLKFVEYRPFSVRTVCSEPVLRSNCKQCLNHRIVRRSGPTLTAIRSLSSNNSGINDLSAGIDESKLNDDWNSCGDERLGEQTMSDLAEAMEVDSNAILNVTKSGVKDDIKEFWHKNDIKVHGKDAPLPILDMDAFEWPEAIRKALEADDFSEPTPIQCQAWPIVLSGRDMVGVAQTGSGKTLCYVLPAFVKILKEGNKRGPKCLILAPTRELAQQIQSVIRRYKFATNVCLYGGASRGPQIQTLRENPQIIVATPGRMNDLMECGAVDVSTIDYLVLDEADRMLDMGFEPQIKRIIDRIPRDRQTVMWSATWPKDVKMLAAQYMNDYIQINVGGTELTANKNIEQVVEVCEEFDKKRKLLEVLQRVQADSPQNKTLIFAKTKQSVDFLTYELRRNGMKATAIHGDKTQMIRDRVLADFRFGRFSILVATDVAARGLDVDDIKYVINYDFPNTTEDYVHRIGRTGRLNKKGTAFTFICSEEGRQANDLIDVLRESNQQVKPELLELAQMSRNASAPAKRRYGGGSNSYMASQRQGFRNNNYGRSDGGRSFNRYNGGGGYGGQRRSAYQSDYESDGFENSNRSNYRSNYRPNYESYNGSNYGSNSRGGPPFRGY